MENELKKLFDYQRFEKNARLETLIRETEDRYAAELSDEELTIVSAAGEMPAELEKILLTDIETKPKTE